MTTRTITRVIEDWEDFKAGILKRHPDEGNLEIDQDELAELIMDELWFRKYRKGKEVIAEEASTPSINSNIISTPEE